MDGPQQTFDFNGKAMDIRSIDVDQLPNYITKSKFSVQKPAAKVTKGNRAVSIRVFRAIEML